MVSVPPLSEPQRHVQCGQVGLSDQVANPLFPRTTLKQIQTIRMQGEAYYGLGSHGAKGADTLPAPAMTDAAATFEKTAEPVPLGATLAEGMETDPALPKRKPIVVDYEDRFVYSVPPSTHAPEAATRVTRVGGILTKNDPFAAPVSRFGTPF